MISYARERAMEVLKTACSAILATSGPAGVQVGEFPCEAVELELYLLLPRTSDHLFNLQRDDRVALHSNHWEVTGTGRALTLNEKRPAVSLLTETETAWHVLVNIKPSQIQVLRREGWGPAETIDLSPLQ
jgi:hypothetical protein